jgi:hypothetical protein
MLYKYRNISLVIYHYNKSIKGNKKKIITLPHLGEAVTKLSVETDELAVIIQEVRNTMTDVQQIYGRGSGYLWAANRSSMGISAAYQQTTTELMRIVNTLQTTRQVLEDLQRDTDKPSS